METDKTNSPTGDEAPEGFAQGDSAPDESSRKNVSREINGPKGPEPTRFGDWEQNGRCSDF